MIRGSSGCKVEIIDDILIKTAINYSHLRLQKQGYKQQAFRQTKDIIAPQVYEIGDGFLKMEYVRAYNFAEFLSRRLYTSILAAFKKIVEWVISSLRPLEELDRLLFVNKVVEIEKSSGCHLDFEIPERIILPSGSCHGDLTLSNILFRESGQLVFIDLLDSFFESPILDVVKLRQDTRFLWSLDLLEGHYDRTKLRILLAKLDEYIDSSFRVYPWYNQYYVFCQQLNLARILPYVDQQKQEELCEYINNPGLW